VQAKRTLSGDYTTVKRIVKGFFESMSLACGLSGSPKAGALVDKNRPTQVGRALKELGIQMIPSYSPQARGLMERSYQTWQGGCRRSCGYMGSWSSLLR
jgi:hypothetical protein